MQLHLIESRPRPEDPRIQSDPAGVPEVTRATAVAARGPSWAIRFVLFAALLSLLGQGERSVIDPQLRSPGSAVASYWEGLQLNDPVRIAACTVQDDAMMPFPGMLWSFPNTHALWLEKLRYVPVDADEVVVSYEVHYKPVGGEEERSLKVMTNVLRVRGEWRVAQPFAETGLLDGRPLPTRVDI